MSFKKFTFLFGFIISLMVITFVAFAQEPAAPPVDSAAVSSGQQVAPKDTNEIQWVWGEVTNFDSQAKTVTLKYLDYETDQEKELVLAVDDKTTFENIKSLDEIKIKDTLSVDYTAGADGKNVAKNINFEKPDSSTTMPAVESTKPPETTSAPATDTSMQVSSPIPSQASVPVEAPITAQVSIPVVTELIAQPETAVELSAPGSGESELAVLTSVSAGQDNQIQQ